MLGGVRYTFIVQHLFVDSLALKCCGDTPHAWMTLRPRLNTIVTCRILLTNLYRYNSTWLALLFSLTLLRLLPTPRRLVRDRSWSDPLPRSLSSSWLLCKLMVCFAFVSKNFFHFFYYYFRTDNWMVCRFSVPHCLLNVRYINFTWNCFLHDGLEISYLFGRLLFLDIYFFFITFIFLLCTWRFGHKQKLFQGYIDDF